MTTYQLDNRERITVLYADPLYLDVEVEFPPGGVAPPRRLHSAQSVHFEVLEGAMHVVARLNVYGETGERLEQMLQHVPTLMMERADTHAFPLAIEAVDGVLFV